MLFPAANTSPTIRPACEVHRWGHLVRVASAGAAVATIAVAGSLMLTPHQDATAASLVSAAAMPAGVGSDSGSGHEMPGMDMPEMDHGNGSAPAATHSDEMPEMDHGSESTPAPTHSDEMPEMDHGSGDAPESGHDSGEIPGMDHGSGKAEASASDRPLVPVLGTFGGGASAVLLTAGLLRRKDRAAAEAKQAARAARRSQK